ncbi:MAG: universal stress protein [Bacteroidota bacterium]
MKRILCPTDFSKAGDNAIAYAAKLCRQLGGSLTLLHVHALGDLTPGEALWGQAQTLAQAQEALEKKCTEVKTAFKIQCAPYVIHTVVDVNAGIVEEAIPFDLLVMGTRGTTFPPSAVDRNTRLSCTARKLHFRHCCAGDR